MTPANDTERQLLNLMTNYKFNLLGSFRSMYDLMRGFSIVFMLSALVMGVLALLLSGESAALLKGVALGTTIWLVLVTAISLHHYLCRPHFLPRGRTTALRPGLGEASGLSKRRLIGKSSGRKRRIRFLRQSRAIDRFGLQQIGQHSRIDPDQVAAASAVDIDQGK